MPSLCLTNTSAEQAEKAVPVCAAAKQINKNKKGFCEFSLWLNEEYIGAGALTYLPQGGIAYLKWIYIEGVHQGKGLAKASLKRIFSDLAVKGFYRIDTDTADGNIIAQKLYRSSCFENMGRTRSYIHGKNDA